MKEIMYETDKVIVEYDMYALGMKYKTYCKRNYDTCVWFEGLVDAINYAKKLEMG